MWARKMVIMQYQEQPVSLQRTKIKNDSVLHFIFNWIMINLIYI